MNVFRLKRFRIKTNLCKFSPSNFFTPIIKGVNKSLQFNRIFLQISSVFWSGLSWFILVNFPGLYRPLKGHKLRLVPPLLPCFTALPAFEQYSGIFLFILSHWLEQKNPLEDNFYSLVNIRSGLSNVNEEIGVYLMTTENFKCFIFFNRFWFEHIILLLWEVFFYISLNWWLFT